MYKYKNLSDQPLDIIGVGRVEPGDEIESELKIETPQLVETASNEQAPLPVQNNGVIGVQMPQPNAVTEATLVTGLDPTPTKEGVN